MTTSTTANHTPSAQPLAHQGLGHVPRAFKHHLQRSAQALLIACGLLYGASALAQSPTPVSGGTLQAIVQPEPVLLTSAFNSAYPIAVVSPNIFEGLLTFDAEQKLQPGLALSWQVSPDGKTITFPLRQNVKWHDGEEFTSADVQFSVMEVWKKLHPRGKNTFSAIESVETPDKYTAVFQLSHPSLVIFSSLNATEGQIIPKHIYAGTDIISNPANLAPIGTGAFKFKEWQKGSHIILEKNENYWDPGKPYLDRIVFRVIPDASGRAAALESGEVLYAPFDPVPMSDVQRLKDTGRIYTVSDGYIWQAAYTFVEFNLRNPVLNDLRVRQAIAHAIDKETLVKNVWYGFGKASTGPIPSTLKASYTSEGVPLYAFDIKKAAQLLDEAGYPVQKDGYRFTLKQQYQNFSENFKNQAEFIRQSLRRVGINVVTQNQDIAGHVKSVYTDYDFDLSSGRWAAVIDPQVGGFRHYWSKSQAPGIPWSNASNYSSPEMDQIIEAVQLEPDADKRSALFHAFQRKAQEDLPVLPLFETQNVTVANTRVHGIGQAPDNAIGSLKNVWISP